MGNSNNTLKTCEAITVEEYKQLQQENIEIKIEKQYQQERQIIDDFKNDIFIVRYKFKLDNYENERIRFGIKCEQCYSDIKYYDTYENRNIGRCDNCISKYKHKHSKYFAMISINRCGIFFKNHCSGLCLKHQIYIYPYIYLEEYRRGEMEIKCYKCIDEKRNTNDSKTI